MEDTIDIRDVSELKGDIINLKFQNQNYQILNHLQQVFTHALE